MKQKGRPHGEKAPRIKLLDLSGIRKLEDQALLRGIETPEFDAMLDTVCRTLFNTAPMPVEFCALGSDFQISIGPRRTLRTPMLVMDEDRVRYLLRLGYDLRDERGHPLAITRRIAPTIEGVARGAWGTPPDMTVSSAEQFGAGIQAEIRKWKTSRAR